MGYREVCGGGEVLPCLSKGIKPSKQNGNIFFKSTWALGTCALHFLPASRFALCDFLGAYRMGTFWKILFIKPSGGLEVWSLNLPGYEGK